MLHACIPVDLDELPCLYICISLLSEAGDWEVKTPSPTRETYGPLMDSRKSSLEFVHPSSHFVLHHSISMVQQPCTSLIEFSVCFCFLTYDIPGVWHMMYQAIISLHH